MLNLPNCITLSRVALSGMVAAFIFAPQSWGKSAALAAFILGAATDYWDGYFARKMGLVSQFGKLVDPIADKALTLTAFFSFAALGLVSIYWVLIIAVREIYITALRLFFPNRIPLAAKQSGKNKTFIQMAYIIFALSYMVAAEAGLVSISWSKAIEQALRVGIVMVVIMTLWSGLRLANKGKAAGIA